MASLTLSAVTLGICGVGGVAYDAIVIRRARSQTEYQPVWEDWLWYAALPCVAYAALVVAAFFLRAHSGIALFGIATVALALFLIGIHNAWDTANHAGYGLR